MLTQDGLGGPVVPYQLYCGVSLFNKFEKKKLPYSKRQQNFNPLTGYPWNLWKKYNMKSARLYSDILGLNQNNYSFTSYFVKRHQWMCYLIKVIKSFQSGVYKIILYVQYYLYSSDDALVVRNMYIKSFFVFYCETYTEYVPRKILSTMFRLPPSSTSIEYIVI